jgi:hypothetical protein
MVKLISMLPLGGTLSTLTLWTVLVITGVVLDAEPSVMQT